MKKRLEPEDVVLGCPVKVDIVARDGRLLLSKGQVINSEERRQYLFASAFKICQETKKSSAHLPVFVRIERLAHRLAKIEDDIANGAFLEGWAARVRALTKDLIETADEDHDAAFAVIHLDGRHKYDVVHHLMCALVCARLGLASGLTDQERFSLVAGALTHDIAVLAMRAELEATERLTEDQLRRIKEHPAAGVVMLADLGVDDPLWLKVVLEHHEYLDQSGYAGMQEDAISLPTRIIALADALSAMLRPRPYRERLLAKEALADLYTDPSGKYDKALVTMLIRELGLFPPGSILKLINRETAIALRARPGFPATPDAVAVADKAGRPFLNTSTRNTSLPETAIAAILPPERAGSIRQLLPNAWKKS